MHFLGHRLALKMNGIGNEIVVLDVRDADGRVGAADARAIGAMPGLRFDQLMVVERARDPRHDARLTIFNIDGSRAEACGNGTRCVAAALGQDATHLVFESDGGLLDVVRQAAGAFTVDMGAPRLAWDAIPLARPVADTTEVALEPPVPGAPEAFVGVSMGNPHAVFFVADAQAVDLARLGPLIETHPFFPARVNVSFVQVLAPDHLVLRVWERGAGATRACGTAACATLVAGVRRGVSAREATVTLPGGDLRIAWRAADGHVLMTGPTEFEAEHRLDPALLPSVAA